MVQHVIEYTSGEHPQASRNFAVVGPLGGSLLIVLVGSMLTSLIFLIPIAIAFVFGQNSRALKALRKSSKNPKNRRKIVDRTQDQNLNCKSEVIFF